MKEETNISDRELAELLKARMLEAEAGDPLAAQLLEAEMKLAFGKDPLLFPAAAKEKEFLEKHQTVKGWKRFKKWLFPGMFVVVAVLYLALNPSAKQVATDPSQQKSVVVENTAQPQLAENTSVLEDKQPAVVPTKTIELNEDPEGNLQLIQTIKKENADCGHPITVNDTVLFSPNSPIGTGNEFEIKGHAADDPMYFEQEHNTVWYRYVAPDAGQLTFDIIPVSQEDDYDFMLYKWEGGDLRTKMQNGQIKPVRSCISRNDKALKSMTGLKCDPELPSYIHSGNGPSYVRYIDVEKGNIFYLLVDNVSPNGKGHTIRFHLHTPQPGELMVGQKFIFDKIGFLDGDIKFRDNAAPALDSLYRFMVHHPTIKVEIDGHTNIGSFLVPINGQYPDAMALSGYRAKAIAGYLVDRGIDPKRLMTKGYGFSKLIVPNPRTIKENKMNVRAEIVILSLDYRK